MADLKDRLAGLSPKQRELLLKALERQRAQRSAPGRGGQGGQEDQETQGAGPSEGGSAGPRPDRFPLTAAQERFWFLDRLEPGSPLYAMSGAFRLRGEVDEAALARAFAGVVERHEALRTVFVTEPQGSNRSDGESSDGEGSDPQAAHGPVQRVLPAAESRPALPVVDLTALPPALLDRLLPTLLAGFGRRPFDLERGPLLRLLLVRLQPGDRVLALALHHIVTDGWSMGVLMGELRALYGHARAGRPPSAALPALPLQYGDWAVRQRRRLGSGGLEAQLDHWRGALDGAPAALELPFDRPRTPLRSPRGGQWRFALAGPVGAGLRRLAQERGATPFMAWLAAFAALLARWSGEADLVLGTPIANRDDPETEGLIGLLLNTLVLRLDAGGDPSYGELLERSRRAVVSAFRHADLPFERLVEALAPERSLSHSPLFQVLFVYQEGGRAASTGTAGGSSPAGGRPGGLAIEPFAVHSGTAKFDLLLDLTDRTGGRPGSDASRPGPGQEGDPEGPGLGASFEYSTDLFDRTTLGRLARSFETLSRGLLETPERPLSRLPWWTPAEAHQVLREWGDGPLHRLPADLHPARLEAWVWRTARRRPDAPAVVAPPAPGSVGEGPEVWSYRRLEEAARAVAHALVADGPLAPETPVALCMARRPALVAAYLGVLEAGGVVVPVDPAYPPERVAFLLADSGARRALVDEGTGQLLGSLPPVDGAPLPALELLTVEDLLVGGAPAGAPSAGEPTPRRLDAPEALAYLIYTSGSTGRPKGVEIPHRAAVALLRWAAGRLPEASRGVLAATSVCFDLSVFELFLPLALGGRLVLAENALALPDLEGLLEEHPVAIVNTVPSAMAELVRDRPLPPSVRTVNLAGEALRRELVEAVLEAGAEGALERVVNLYGPSEDTTYSTAWVAGRSGEPVAAGAPPIGPPLAGTGARIVHGEPQAAPGAPLGAGSPGELLLGASGGAGGAGSERGGEGLARGYRGRPALTAERFVPDPWSASPGGRLYRTGDRVRWRRDGVLEYLGRLDRQVKLRGFRIEPGEVEAALRALPLVAAAAVEVLTPAAAVSATAVSVTAVSATDRATHGRLVAFLETAGGAAASPSRDEELREVLRSALAARLPAHLVPAAFVVLPALPLTPNGKVDRRALRALPEALWLGGGGAGADPGDPAWGGALPRSGVEELLAELWAEVLGTRPGPGSDFFAEGGHSLLATQLVSRVRRAFGVELPVRTVFRHPTLAGLARALEGALRRRSDAPAAPPLVARPRAEGDRSPDLLPLSFSQERLWFLEQLEPGNAAYHIPSALRLAGPLDTAALARAYGELVRRHESLRTTFRLERVGGAGREPRQVVAPPPTAGEILRVIDLSGLPAARREREVRRLARAEARRPFDLAAGPLLRVRLVRLVGGDGDGAGATPEHALVTVMHHIVSDGWSLGIVTRELALLYGAFAAGRPSPLPELPLQYGDWAAWQRRWLDGEDGEGAPTGALEELVGFWRGALGEGPHLLDLPTDRPRPPLQTFPGARRVRRLPARTSRALRHLSRRAAVTPFMTSLALTAALLGRLCHQDRVTLGSPVAHRNRAEVEGLVGFFVNTLVLPVDLAGESSREGQARDEQPKGEPSLGELLARVRELTLDAQAHQDLPFEKLVEALDPRLVGRNLARPPLFQVLFAFQNTPRAEVELPGLEVSGVFEAAPGATKFDLTFDLQETGDHLTVALEHNTDLFDPSTAELLLRRFEVLAEAAGRSVEGALERPLSSLPMATRAERFQALREWNEQPLPLGVDRIESDSLHGLVLARAARVPDARALITADGGELTYRQLAARALDLTRRLRSRGVGPETRVGVLLPRTLDLPVSLLGVLAAGATYVPLDPAYPAERIAFMIEDSGARVVVTDGRGAAALGASPVEALVVGTGEDAGEDAGEDVELSADPLTALAPELPPELPGAQSGAISHVIYTSGSTGRPKGVAIRHRSVVALLAWAAREFPEAAGPGAALAATSVCFDLSIFELFLPLSLGGTVALAESALHLPALAERVPVTLVNTVPSALAELVRAGELPPSVETVNLAGEPLEAALVAAIHRRGPGVRRVVNLYGPSEDTTYSTWAVAPPGEPPAIGRPVAGTRAHVLGPDGRPALPGAEGQLFLGGEGVARGYLGRPALTAERFVPDPFIDPHLDAPHSPDGAGGGRLYRTGDRVRQRKDGSLDFLGRFDHQVKLRGFRIELGEVETALGAHPAVAEVAVGVRREAGSETAAEAGAGRGDRLVAWVALEAPAAASAPAEASDPRPDAAALRAWLGSRLPAYMVPSAVVFLEALPRTANGKLDRKALPEPEAPRSSVDHEPPRTELERTVARIWGEVLGVEGLGIRDNFFDLGGHSLLMVRAYHRLQEELGRELPLVATFAHPTVATLAAYLEGDADEPAAREAGEERGERRRQALEARRRQARDAGSRPVRETGSRRPERSRPERPRPERSRPERPRPERARPERPRPERPRPPGADGAPRTPPTDPPGSDAPDSRSPDPHSPDSHFPDSHFPDSVEEP